MSWRASGASHAEASSSTGHVLSFVAGTNRRGNARRTCYSLGGCRDSAGLAHQLQQADGSPCSAGALSTRGKPLQRNIFDNQTLSIRLCVPGAGGMAPQASLVCKSGGWRGAAASRAFASAAEPLSSEGTSKISSPFSIVEAELRCIADRMRTVLLSEVPQLHAAATHFVADPTALGKLLR